MQHVWFFLHKVLQFWYAELAPDIFVSCSSFSNKWCLYADICNILVLWHTDMQGIDCADLSTVNVMMLQSRILQNVSFLMSIRSDMANIRSCNVGPLGCLFILWFVLSSRGRGFDSWSWVFMCGLCMFLFCLCGFSPGSAASYHSPKTGSG